jgi:hypothetical protein
MTENMYLKILLPLENFVTIFQWRDCTQYSEWYWDEILDLCLIQKCGIPGDKFSPFMIYISTLWLQRADPVSVWWYFSWRKVMFRYDSRGCLCYWSQFGYCSIERKAWVKIRVETWVGITESRRRIYESVKISAEENVGYVTICYEINCDVLEAQIVCVWQ